MEAARGPIGSYLPRDHQPKDFGTLHTEPFPRKDLPSSLHDTPHQTTLQVEDLPLPELKAAVGRLTVFP
jgi:hypothetical protein